MTENMIFYGAGVNMKNLLAFFDKCDIPFNCPIWDINADKIESINGHSVCVPDFESRVSGKKAVVTISDISVAHTVTDQLQNIGFEVIRGNNGFLDFTEIPKHRVMENFPADFTDFEKELIYSIKSENLTMVSFERLYATLSACKYTVQNDIDGDFVECGVWRGGNAILAAKVFEHYGSKKKVWLFDTFEGFLNISRSDKDTVITKKELARKQQHLYDTFHCGNSLDSVQANFKRYGVLSDRIVFVVGDVNKTLTEDSIPTNIAVLRTDTDLYESTKKQLQVLYPRLSKYGVFMEDDYYYSNGARAAINEYFENAVKPLFHRIDHAGMLVIKTI